jgi:hypothetical protein
MSANATPLAHRRPTVPIVALLWCAGIIAMVAVTGGDAWPLALGWAAAGTLLALVWRRLAGRPGVRACGAAVVLVALIALAWEGGLFLVPAVLAGLALSLRDRVRAAR